jgi:hypothetical protein
MAPENKVNADPAHDHKKQTPQKEQGKCIAAGRQIVDNGIRYYCPGNSYAQVNKGVPERWVLHAGSDNVLSWQREAGSVTRKSYALSVSKYPEILFVNGYYLRLCARRSFLGVKPLSQPTPLKP